MRFRQVKFRSGFFLSLIFGLLVSLPAFGQVATRGSLAGSAIDSTGAVIVGAAVTATNPATGEVIRATTDAQGAFIFPSLAVGRYTITIEAATSRPRRMGRKRRVSRTGFSARRLRASLARSRAVWSTLQASSR